eukprot:s3649_g7.t1
MYLFAGKRRQSDVASFLQRAHDAGRIKLTLKEFDLELSPDHDLTDSKLWDEILSTLKEGGWYLIVSPPCNTFSRARFHYIDSPGPRPLRNINWPRGFPWLSERHKMIVNEANLFVDRCVDACLVCHNAGGKFILEHPEDLGTVQDERPGSIWQWESVLELIPACRAITFAIQQCKFGAITPKPTRFLGTFEVTDARCFLGLPKFDVLGFYKGPLPKSCGHVHKHKLLGKTQNKWNTSPAASYPLGLCEFLAQLILTAGSCGRGAKNQQQAQQQKSTVSSQQQANAMSSGVSSNSSSGVAFSAVSSMHVSSGVGDSSSIGVSNVVCNADVAKGAPSGNPGSSEVVDLTGEVSQEAEYEGVDEFEVEKCGNYGKPIKVEWSPGARGHNRTQPMKDLAAATFRLLLDGVHSAVQDIRKEAFKLVTGKLQESPFSVELLADLRRKLADLLRDPTDALVRDNGQPFFLRLLAQWLEVFEDPDVQCLVNDTDSFASGVNVGVESPLPRSPQVFPPKRKHRKLDGTEFNPIAENYVSAQISSKELESKFREEEMMGRMEPSKLSVLKQKFGDKLRVASMAAILKPDGGVRPVHDATHSVMVNHSIKYRDQLQCPGPAEVAAVVREAIETKEAAFCVSADIKSAHRLVKVRESDWPYLCCRADSLSETVWLNKTGTFGVSSAPYWWAKLFAAIGRFVGHLMQSSPFWHMVYVDDLHGAFTGVHKFEALWVWLLAFEVIGAPFGYHKFKGGFSSDFVGFHLRYDKNEVGITAKRGAWLVDWIRALEEKRFVVAARDFSEFVGRLCFVSQLLVWLKPHLAPLFAWAAVTSAGMVGKLPDTVILTLKYIQSEMVEETFMVSARRPLYFNVEQFRTDAKCTDDCVVLGGWELETRRWFVVSFS